MPTDETEFSSAETQAAPTDQWEGALAWAAEDPAVPDPVVARSYTVPVVAVVASVATAAGVLAMVLTVHTTTAVAPMPATAPVPPSSSSPLPSLQPLPAEPSTEPPAPSTVPPVDRDAEFIGDLQRDGMHFPYGSGAAVTEGHTVCDRLASGELRAMVVVDVIAGSVVPGYLPLTLVQARDLVDDAVSIYCPTPTARAGAPGPGHYTVA